jgi:hypothetical protein
MIDINQSHERVLLSRLALRYTPRDYIASKLFPWILVPQDRVSYFKFDRGATFKRATALYGARSAANELELKGTKLTHDLSHKGLGAWIDDDERRLTDGIGDIRAIKMQMLKDAHFLDLEKRVAGSLFTAANYAAANKATLAGATQWSDSTSDPKKAVIDAAAGLIKQPNTMVVGRQVHNALLTHTKVLDAVKYTMGGVTVTEETLARYFGVERYFVGGAHEDTAQEGQAESLGYIWGKFAWIGYVNYTNAVGPALISQPSFGYLPISRGSTGNPWRVYTKAPDPTMGVGDGMEYIKVDATYEPLFPAYDLGFLWSAAVA